MKNNLRLIVNNEEVIRTPKRGVLALVVDNTVSSSSSVVVEEKVPSREDLLSQFKALKSEYLKKVGLNSN